MSKETTPDETRAAAFRALPEGSQRELRERWESEISTNRKLIKAANETGNFREAGALEKINSVLIQFMKETA